MTKIPEGDPSEWSEQERMNFLRSNFKGDNEFWSCPEIDAQHCQEQRLRLQRLLLFGLVSFSTILLSLMVSFLL